MPTSCITWRTCCRSTNCPTIGAILIGEVNAPLPLCAGRVKCEDYEYERKGVCNQFMCCEPLRGWRHVRVTARRTKRDWAECIRELADVSDPHATRIRLVLDNLNTHTGAS